jgi:hypothetical protein
VKGSLNQNHTNSEEKDGAIVEFCHLWSFALLINMELIISWRMIHELVRRTAIIDRRNPK